MFNVRPNERMCKENFYDFLPVGFGITAFRTGESELKEESAADKANGIPGTEDGPGMTSIC